MIKSMTGYGKAVAETDKRTIIVEVRSLNSKQLDLSVKSPSMYRPLEYEIRNRAAKVIQRGKADIFITYENKASAPAATINKDLFKAYYNTLNELSADMGQGREDLVGAMMSSILRMPEVVSNESCEVGEQEKKALLSAADNAMIEFDNFRLQEGKTLINDILGRIDKIEGYKNDVVPFEKRRVDTVKERIRENILALDLKVDENRLEQEMIFYVEKLDITEEKVRLDNHCRYFKEVASQEENPGRKLGFIAQEIGREINTMGSKANDSDIQKIVVQMKDELEKIKEQILNIL